jgi:hypothetical protein
MRSESEEGMERDGGIEGGEEIEVEGEGSEGRRIDSGAIQKTEGSTAVEEKERDDEEEEEEDEGDGEREECMIDREDDVDREEEERE